MDELDCLIDKFKNSYSLIPNLKLCKPVKGQLNNESFPILPPFPSTVALSSDETIRLFCDVINLRTDNFVCKVYEITTSGILCQLIYQIGPMLYQDLSKLQIFGLIPFDMISAGIIKKIKTLCRSNSSIHFLALVEEIAQIKKTIFNTQSLNKDDLNAENKIDNLNVDKMNTVTSTKPLIILSIANNDNNAENRSDFKPFTLAQMNLYRSLFEPENESSKQLEDEADDYTSLIQKHPSFHNLSCYSNILQTENISVRGTPFTFIKDLKDAEYPKDCSTFAATLRKKQAHSWALPSIKKGIHYFNTSRNAEALQCYNKALQIDPTNAEALVARGAMYATCLNFDKALQDFSEAISHDPFHSNAHKYLGQTLVTKAKRLEKELGKLEKKKKMLEAIDEENERATIARIKILRNEIGSYYYQASIHMPESEGVKYKLKEYGIVTAADNITNEQSTSRGGRDRPTPLPPTEVAVDVRDVDEVDDNVSLASSGSTSSNSSSAASSSSTQSSDSSASVSSSSPTSSRSPSPSSVSTPTPSRERSVKRVKRLEKSEKPEVAKLMNGNAKHFKYSTGGLNRSKRDFTPRSDSLTPSPIILLPSPDEDPEFWFQNMNWGSPLPSSPPYYYPDYNVEESHGRKHPGTYEDDSVVEKRQNSKSSQKKHKSSKNKSDNSKSEGHKKHQTPEHIDKNGRNHIDKNLKIINRRDSDIGKKENKELQDMESFLETLKRKASTTSTNSK